VRGFFEPGSISWRVDREVALLAGGTCALLMQLAHPAVAAGVEQHSDFRTDPFGRLRRTLHSSLSIVFEERSRAERSVARVNAIHRRISGVIPESGASYTAADPALLLWVHATLVDTGLRVYDRFVQPLSDEEMDAYHREAREIAVRLGIPMADVPESLPELRAEMRRLIRDGDVSVSPTARRLAERVLYPAGFPPRFVWDLGNLVSVSLLPAELRRQYRIPWNGARERAVDRLAALSRRVLPLVPNPLRYVPQARSAERRLRVAMMAAP
jgi:uncharacterized protein (DUF2236 family)